LVRGQWDVWGKLVRKKKRLFYRIDKRMIRKRYCFQRKYELKYDMDKPGSKCIKMCKKMSRDMRNVETRFIASQRVPYILRD